MKIEIEEAEGLLRVVASGAFSIGAALNNFLETLDAVERTGAKKILIDGRTVSGKPEIIERFIYGEFAAKAVARSMMGGALRRMPQFAYVLHVPMRHPSRFGETVAVNRGLWVKVFDSVEEALEWLASQ
jgi:hypothetical protein